MLKNSSGNKLGFEHRSLGAKIQLLKRQITWKISWGRSTLERKIEHLNLQWNEELLYYEVTPKVMPPIYFNGKYNRYEQHGNTIW